MESIVDDLIEAGYFRAKLNNLSDFDKIVGGMAWAIQVFSNDVNIPIFYTDSMGLGEKIALTEKLVMVLLVVNCPHTIEPHQIVGLDYVSLLPVIKWLMKRSSEVRREHEAFNKLLALRYFYRATKSFPPRNKWQYILTVDNCNSPKRVLRKDIDFVSRTNKSEGITSTSTTLHEKLSKLSNPSVSFLELSHFMSRSIGIDREGDTSVEEFESIGSAELLSLKRIEEEEEVLEIFPISDNSKNSSEHLNERQESLEGCIDKLTKSQSDTITTSYGENTLSEELNTELLATNQKILNLLRKLDSKPSRLEVSQYQRRYVELHHSIIGKNKDFKKLYSLFNTLDSTKHYMLKEINILDSINENLDRVRYSISNQEDFLRQFIEIITKVQCVRDDIVSRLKSIRYKRDSLIIEHASLLNQM